MSIRRLIAATTVAALAVSFAGPATANQKKPPTERQVLAALLSPAEASQATGFPQTLNFLADYEPGCGGEGKTFMCTEVFDVSGVSAGSEPHYFIGVAPYATAKAATAAVKTLPGVGDWTRDRIVSRTAKEIVLFYDDPPGSTTADAVTRVAAVGRFVITTMCVNTVNEGTQQGLQDCAKKLADAQAKKLAKYQAK